MAEESLNGAWGLADDVMSQIGEDADVRHNRYLLARMGNETVAIPDHKIFEVVDEPKVTPWLREKAVVGVFALRGDIYTLTDPLLDGEIRRIAVIVDLPGRFVAVACDKMVGVEHIADDEWEDLDSPSYAWARRLWKRGDTPTVQLDPEVYLELLSDPAGKESHT